MIDYIVVIITMIGGFVSLLINNIGGAYCLFGYSFIWLCLTAIGEYRTKSKEKK